jgi:ribonuclease E
VDTATDAAPATDSPVDDGDDANEGAVREGGRRRNRRGRRDRDDRDGRKDDAVPQAADATSTEGAETLAPAAVVVPQQVSLIEAALSAHDSGVAAPTPAPTPAPSPSPVVAAQPFVLPLSDLQAIAEGAGLQWVNSDADKIAAAQAAIAAEPAPAPLGREPAPVTVLDEGPLVLVETRKDLSQVKLPFES